MLGNVVLEVGLALALIVIAAFLARKLHISNVPLLILAGMVVGPHIPAIGPIDLSFTHSAEIIAFLGKLGVLFLLFYLGLEFSVSRLVQAGRSITIGGTIYISINFTLALLFGWAAGWPYKEVLVAAGIISTSSSAIVAKVLVDLKRTANPETEMILGIIMFEDVFLAAYLSVVSGLVLTGGASLGSSLRTAAVALAFIAALLILGRKFVPWLNRVLNALPPETYVLGVFALLMLVAGFSETIHVAEAIGALLTGLVLAETDHAKDIEHLIIPFRDVFGAFFFFHFGLTINPLTLAGAGTIALVAVLVTLAGNYTAGMLAGRTVGLSKQASSNIGLTIVSRGEFSIVMANLALTGGLLPVLQPFSALYVLVLAVLGPLLTKESRLIHTLIWGKSSQARRAKSKHNDASRTEE